MIRKCVSPTFIQTFILWTIIIANTCTFVHIHIHTYTHTCTNEQGHTPLHYAAACSRVDVCALLLDLGADATQRDSEGLSPLDYARRKKLDYVVALLTCHGTALADFARASRLVGGW